MGTFDYVLCKAPCKSRQGKRSSSPHIVIKLDFSINGCVALRSNGNEKDVIPTLWSGRVGISQLENMSIWLAGVSCTRLPYPPPDAGYTFGKHMLSFLWTYGGKAKQLKGPNSSSALLRYYCFVCVSSDLAGHWSLLFQASQLFGGSCGAIIAPCKALYYFPPLSMMDLGIRIVGRWERRPLINHKISFLICRGVLLGHVVLTANP